MFAVPSDLDRPDARQRVDKIMIRRGKETIFELNENGDLVKKFRDRDPHPIEIDLDLTASDGCLTPVDLKHAHPSALRRTATVQIISGTNTLTYT